MSVTINGTNGLVFNDNSTQATAATGFGFKNRIINGAMVIDQRNNGASSTVNGNYCTVDRFKAGNNTNAGTIQRITSTLSGFQNSIKYTAAGSNTFFQLGQQIEFSNCADLQNQTITITFKAKANNSNSGSTALIVRTRTVAGIDGAAIFSGTNVDTSITLTTSDASYSVTRTLPSTFGALSVEVVLGSHVSGDGLEITGIQIEKGSTATSFDYRPYGTELALCYRYYQQWGGDASFERIGNGYNASTTQARVDMTLAVTMRSAPTLSVSSASNWAVEHSGGSAACTSISLDQPSTRIAATNFNVASGLTSGQGCHVIANNTTSARFNLSSEL